ncbi:MAG: hypothetical protein ACKVI4_17520 [Actinomycetales bacterium]
MFECVAYSAPPVAAVGALERLLRRVAKALGAVLGEPRVGRLHGRAAARRRRAGRARADGGVALVHLGRVVDDGLLELRAPLLERDGLGRVGRRVEVVGRRRRRRRHRRHVRRASEQDAVERLELQLGRGQVVGGGLQQVVGLLAIGVGRVQLGELAPERAVGRHHLQVRVGRARRRVVELHAPDRGSARC